MRRGRGFNLLEIMLAVALLAVALLAVVGVFSGGLHLMARSRELTTATEVGRQVLESIKSSGYAAIPTTDMTFDGRGGSADLPLPGPPPFPPSPYPVTVIDGRPYEIVVRVTSPGLTNVRAVEVEVFWGPTGHHSLQTFFHP